MTRISPCTKALSVSTSARFWSTFPEREAVLAKIHTSAPRTVRTMRRKGVRTSPRRDPR